MKPAAPRIDTCACGEPVLTVELRGRELVIDRSEASPDSALPRTGVVLMANNEVRPWYGYGRRKGDAIHRLHVCAQVA